MIGLKETINQIKAITRTTFFNTQTTKVDN